MSAAEANQDASNAWKDADKAAFDLIGNGIEARVGRATVLAQLAVAAEIRALRESQNTANLIAWHSHLVSTDQVGAVSARMADQIYTRLGF